jgi:hypothetical protein
MTWTAILAIGGRIDHQGATRRLEFGREGEVTSWQRVDVE